LNYNNISVQWFEKWLNNEKKWALHNS
jgi:hypothetical protein